MSIVQKIKEAGAKAIRDLYQHPVDPSEVTVSQTKPEFEGDYTVVLFALVKQLKKSPDQLGQELGSRLMASEPALFTGFNLIKGFLNLSVADSFFSNFLSSATDFRPVANGKKVVVEYSSPNTNKPLHLGHLRNNFLGWSVAEILKASGNEVLKSCVVNDRGIHICKSMIAWQLFSGGETPASTHTKGDHFVGDYYVRCESRIREESAEIMARVDAGDLSDFEGTSRQKMVELNELLNAVTGNSEKDNEKRKKLLDDRKETVRANTPIMLRARQMLVDWENGDPEVIALWKKMNDWVYEGFSETYKRIGSDFDRTYYESGTYLLGKKFVEEGLMTGVFFRKDDGSVWIDLKEEGLDEKLLLRKDGTSVYMTQDLGLAEDKYKDFPYDQSLYVIADEQNYHMKVLQAILAKLGKPYASGIYHLSYGMVELPSGRMKSREGTVVDADDLMDEMVKEAAGKTSEKSKVDEFTEPELKELYETIALGALKFFLLKVDPKKKMVFNPEESIDFHGFTGPFIQYTYARIRSILRKNEGGNQVREAASPLLKLEKQLLVLLEQYPEILRQASAEFNPASIANYIYSVAQAYKASILPTACSRRNRKRKSS
jgi:arginyl-tRNA synthetase